MFFSLWERFLCDLSTFFSPNSKIFCNFFCNWIWQNADTPFLALWALKPRREFNWWKTKCALTCNVAFELTAGNPFFFLNFRRDYEERWLSLKENGTRNGHGTCEKKNRLQTLLTYLGTFTLVKIIYSTNWNHLFLGASNMNHAQALSIMFTKYQRWVDGNGGEKN